MKIYKGTAKVKEDSGYVYAGHTFNIDDVYMEYKNGSGNGVIPDGSRDYKLNLINTPFEGDFGKMTVINCKYLEITRLVQTIVLPFDEQEVLELIEYTTDNIRNSNEDILSEFIHLNTKDSPLPEIDYTTIYDEEEFFRRNKLKKSTL